GPRGRGRVYVSGALEVARVSCPADDVTRLASELPPLVVELRHPWGGGRAMSGNPVPGGRGLVGGMRRWTFFLVSCTIVTMEIVADTSAFLAVVLNEPERQRIVKLTAEASLLAPEFLPYEIGNALTAMV